MQCMVVLVDSFFLFTHSSSSPPLPSIRSLFYRSYVLRLLLCVYDGCVHETILICVYDGCVDETILLCVYDGCVYKTMLLCVYDGRVHETMIVTLVSKPKHFGGIQH